MNWCTLFVVFVVCHLVGDFLLQTDWQATHKYGGLGGDPERFRALASHVLTYTLAFLPALVWIGVERKLWEAVAAGVLIYAFHLFQDDGRLLDAYMRRVKGPDSIAIPGIRTAVDQSFHLVTLLGTAFLVLAF
jgi:hypothetical protein